MTTDKARFTAITPYCIRIEYSASGIFVDKPSYFAVNRDARDAQAKIATKAGRVSMDTGIIRLEYRDDGRPLDQNNLHAYIHGAGKSAEWKPGLTNTGNLGGTERTLDGWDGAKQKLSDGLLSRDGWFWVDDSHSVLFKDDWFQARTGDGGVDGYLFGYGNDYKAALKSLTAVSGPVPLPRRYTLGAWYSRYWPYRSEEFRQIVKEYTEHDFPLDVIVMDMDWHLTDVPGVPRGHANQIWTGYTWNRQLLPDAEALLKWFHEQGLAVTLNDHPADGVWPHEECYPGFMQAMGADPASQEHLPFDAGNRKYMDTFYDATHLPLETAGVDFWWLDWQQFPNTRSIPELPNLSALNEYYSRRAARDDKRGVSFSRWAGWGDHRHPIHFSGDASTAFKMLAFEVPFTATAGNVGCFFWSHDIGGHNRGRNEESYARWCQFGAFSAALRSHSTRDAKMDRRPWTYPSWAEDSMRISFHLRSRFFPYTYSCAQQSCAESIPLLRPMYLEYPAVESAYAQPQQYLYGGDVLVAPVAEAGAGPRRLGRQVVWFPKGSWYDFLSGERFDGPQERLVAATIDEFPLYVRGGTPIPMRPYTLRMTSAPLTNLVVRCYPGAKGQTGSFTLYEDDGLSQGYSRGEFAKTPITYQRTRNRVVVKLASVEGHFSGQPQERSYVIELPATQKATWAQVDGQPVSMEYVEAEDLNRITVPARSIRRGCEVSVEAADADQVRIQACAFARRTGLPQPPAGSTRATLLQASLTKAGDEREKAAVLAATGAGAFSKIESPNGYPAVAIEKTYRSGK